MNEQTNECVCCTLFLHNSPCKLNIVYKIQFQYAKKFYTVYNTLCRTR